MSSVDNRVVKMQFDNASFKREALATKSSLEQVDAAVAKTGSNKGLLNMAGHMETVRVKASAMQVAAVTAIANIANRAVNAGMNMAKSFTLDPIKQGFDEYELKMKSIQTILANTKGESLKTVTAALNELNEYSDKTIYNFANMTQNIGKLTTAGIELDDATAVVKGFHNMVALAGGDATAAAGAMEQFGQGLQAGTIKAMDWMSISNRGLGSQSLQKAFWESAKALGTLTDIPAGQTFEEWGKANGGFKASLEAGWLTTDVATTALKAMTGDVKNVQELMKQGFSKEAATDLLKIANNAVDSATKVRTFTGFMDTLKESIASGWGQVMETVIGDFNEATNMFTRMSEVVGGAVGNMFDWLNKMLKGWDRLGGRAAILTTFQHLLAPIGAILKVIGAAWKAAFPAGKAGSGLATASKALEHITRPLEVLAKLIEGSIGPLTFFFRLWRIGFNAVRNFGDYLFGFLPDFKSMFNIDVPAGGGFLGFIKDIAKAVGDAIKKIDNLVAKGASLTSALGAVNIDMPDMPNMPDIPKMPNLPDLGGMFGGAGKSASKVTALTASVKGLTGSMEGFNKVDSDAADGMMFNPDADISKGRVVDIVKEDAADLKEAGGFIGNAFDTIKQKIAEWLGAASFDDLIASFNIAVLSVFFIRMSQMMKTFTDGFKGFTGAMGAIEGALGSFQTSARAKLITSIAIAIAILAAAIWVLSRIPKDKLMNAVLALAAVGIIMKVSLNAFSDTIEKLDGKGINMKMVALGISMVLLSISITILASAMKKLNDVDWASVLKAGAALAMLTIAMQVLGKIDQPLILKTAFAMVIISSALMLFAIAITKFAGLDFKTFGEGMLYVAIALGVLATTMNKFVTSLPGAIALVVVVGALWLLVPVINKYASMDFETFAKGMAKVALALVGLVFALHGFQSSLAGAAAMIVVIYGLDMLHKMISKFADMDWGTFAKGLGIVVIALVAIAAVLALIGFFSPLILAGAAALLVFAAAIALIGVGLAAMTTGLAGLIALGAGLGAAITAFFTSLAIGIAVFLATLAAEAPIIKKALLDILQVIIDSIVEAVPMIIDGFKRLFAAIKKEFSSGGEGGGKMKAVMGDTGKSWIDKLKDGIKKMIPKIVDGAIEIGKKFINGLIKHAPAIAKKGIELVVSLINAIASKAGDIIEAGVNLVVKLAEGLGSNLDDILEAGVQLIADFLHGLASAIRNGSKAIGGGVRDVVDAFYDVGVDLVQGLINGIKSLASKPEEWIEDIVGALPGWAKKLLGISSPSKKFIAIGKFLVEGLSKGIRDNASAAIVEVASMVSGTISVAADYVSKFVQDLDQKALAATAKAAGLQAAAQKAANAAEKTKKNKKDDTKARELQNKADDATRRAEKREAAAERAREKAARAEEFEEASLIDKAQMRAEDAQMTLDEAKAAEFEAESKRQQAAALREQAKKKGVSNKDAKEFRKAAEKLEKAAEQDAKRANRLLASARTQAGEAMTLQTQAAQEAALDFQARYDKERKLDEEEAAYNAMTEEQKIAERRRQADALQRKADADLARAKTLAYTDLDAANALAEEAIAGADQARQYLQEALQMEQQMKQSRDQQSVDVAAPVVDLSPTEAAAIAFGDYSAMYDAAYAAAAGTHTVEFNQYNSSPEALNPTDVYRNTQNQLAFAAGKLTAA